MRALTATARRGGRHLLALEYPPSSSSTPRYGFGRPPHHALHKLISHRDAQYRARLDEFVGLGLLSHLSHIPLDDPADGRPHWNNIWLSRLDAIRLYGFLQQRNPKQYLEIGSGMSTRWARLATRTEGLQTRITSIDPSLRKEIASLCDTRIDRPLEGADLNIFDQLTAGDVLFMDGSHRVFTNSDATVFALDVLPRLPEGVLVGVHDILLPYDYPASWSERYYSEQYLLAAFLLGGGQNCRIDFPVYYVYRAAALGQPWREAWQTANLPGTGQGQAFWFETGPSAE